MSEWEETIEWRKDKWGPNWIIKRNVNKDILLKTLCYRRRLYSLLLATTCPPDNGILSYSLEGSRTCWSLWLNISLCFYLTVELHSITTRSDLGVLGESKSPFRVFWQEAWVRHWPNLKCIDVLQNDMLRIPWRMYLQGVYVDSLRGCGCFPTLE